ncbi:MAG: hypothetical protein LBF86_03165 [Helicobacteraceae bacterium]|jgi:hypothetical protein|nr:hypothetical protein [Helicobacteraceae bacterium]
MLIKDRFVADGNALFRRRSFVPIVMIAIAALELFPKNAEAFLQNALSFASRFELVDRAAQELLSLSLSLSLSLWRRLP